MFTLFIALYIIGVMLSFLLALSIDLPNSVGSLTLVMIICAFSWIGFCTILYNNMKKL